LVISLNRDASELDIIDWWLGWVNWVDWSWESRWLLILGEIIHLAVS
jgi:hypothetical protein